MASDFENFETQIRATNDKINARTGRPLALAITVGLLDDHTPPHAAINTFYQISPKAREKRLLVHPWLGHGGLPEDTQVLLDWMKQDDPEHRDYLVPR